MLSRARYQTNFQSVIHYRSWQEIHTHTHSRHLLSPKSLSESCVATCDCERFPLRRQDFLHGYTCRQLKNLFPFSLPMSSQREEIIFSFSISPKLVAYLPAQLEEFPKFEILRDENPFKQIFFATECVALAMSKAREWNSKCLKCTANMCETIHIFIFTFHAASIGRLL